MLGKLNAIRTPKDISNHNKVICSIAILTFGIALGLFSKVLDETANSSLPIFVAQLDLCNFFSRMGIWLFIAICISLYTKNPIRAGINVLLFFVGMVSSYYLYTVFIVGFFPKSYMMIWIVITLLSPLLGAICWYARGTHTVSVIISSFIFAVMAMTAFNLGIDFSYFDVSYFLELFLFLATVLVLYNTPKQIAKVIGLGSVLFILLSLTPLRYFIF
ncbi:MAG: DUF6518 family protein [Clostridia bacterium]